MQDARTRLALLIVCLASLLGSGFVLIAGHHAAPPPITISPPPTEAAAATPATAPYQAPPTASKLAGLVYVDVAGAVRRPSLYALPPDSRIMQAVLAAGGPTSEADMDAVNLAEKVTDGEKILVPKRGTTPLVSTPSDAPPAPAHTASAHMAVKSSKGSGSSRGGKIMVDSGEQIALNTATEADLERLPGVGPSMAGRILAYRKAAGRFEKVEDLMQVTGIGPKKFAKIAPLVKPD